MPIVFPRDNDRLSSFERIAYAPQLNNLLNALDDMGLNKTRYDDFNGPFWDDEEEEDFFDF